MANTPSQFTDNTGKVWTLDINVDSIESVHGETNVSIYELLNDKCKPLADLLGNMPAFAHVCYILTGAAEAGIERRDFARALKGDPFGKMVDAFLEELTLFFPDARRRAAIAQMAKAWQSFENQALDQLATEMSKIDPEEVARNVLMKMLSKKSGDSPELQESNLVKSAD